MSDFDSEHALCIYKITNNINGKIYIGQTRNKVIYRWKDHIRNKKPNSAISLALRKYGVENFSFNVISIAENAEQLNHQEEFWVNHYNSLSPNGYNIKGGGKSKLITDEFRRKVTHPHTQATKNLLKQLAIIQFQNPANRKFISDLHTGTIQSKSTIEKRMTKIIGVKTSKNNSGYVGVKIGKVYITGGGQFGDYKLNTRKFSIKKYGYETALKMAIEYRNIFNEKFSIEKLVYGCKNDK